MANVQTWNWPWPAASWVPDSFWGDINDRLRLLDVESSGERQKFSLWQTLGHLTWPNLLKSDFPSANTSGMWLASLLARDAASARDSRSESGADSGSDSDNSD